MEGWGPGAVRTLGVGRTPRGRLHVPAHRGQHLPSGLPVASVLSFIQSCPTLCNPMDCTHQASLSVTNSQSLLKLMSIELVRPSKHLTLCRPLLLPHLIFLCIRWPKYWSFSFSISPSHEYSGLISFRIDRLGLLAVQGTLKSLFQHHSSKASILWRSAFFMVQLSRPYMTTGKPPL